MEQEMLLVQFYFMTLAFIFENRKRLDKIF